MENGTQPAMDIIPTQSPSIKPLLTEVTCNPSNFSTIKAKMILRGVNFRTASAELTEESYAILDRVYNSLEAFPKVKIQISGHTDSQGGSSYNRALSQDRAESVGRYLISRGIASRRIKAVGYGEDRPIASNRTAVGRAKNRRVEIIPIK